MKVKVTFAKAATKKIIDRETKKVLDMIVYFSDKNGCMNFDGEDAIFTEIVCGEPDVSDVFHKNDYKKILSKWVMGKIESFHDDCYKYTTMVVNECFLSGGIRISFANDGMRNCELFVLPLKKNVE